MGQQRADAAIFCGELNLDDLVLSMVDRRSPTDTLPSLGANRLLVFPSNAELAGINAVLRVGLPLHIATNRTNHAPYNVANFGHLFLREAVVREEED